MSLFSKKEAPVDKGIAPNVYLNYNGATCLVADVKEDCALLDFDTVNGTKCGTDGWYKLSRLNSDPGVQPITSAKTKYKRQITIPNYVTEEWCDAVKKLIDKLGATYSHKDASRFHKGEDHTSIVIEYDDPDVDVILSSLSICDYLHSEIFTTDKENDLKIAAGFPAVDED